MHRDVRTPLGLIVGAAQKLLGDDGRLTVMDWRREVQAIIQNARQLEASVMRADPTPPPTAPHVLVVDHDADHALMLVMALRYHGVNASSAPDGPAALVLAADRRPDVAVIAVDLRGMDGFEVARRLRLVPGVARTRFIAVTSYGRDFDAREAHAAGFEHRLEKPVGVDALHAAIKAPTLRP
jgi:CheY-like chemotaxis protein